MIYSEHEPKRNWIWLLIFGFVVLITPQISLRPLNKSEAIFGSIAHYFPFSHQYLTPLIQGQEVDAAQSFFPSLLMSLFSQSVPVEFSVRFHSFIAALLLALLAASFTRKYSKNRLSAIVAGLCIFSSIISFKFSTVGDLRMLSCFFLSLAWITLYKYGSQKEWLKAWMYSLSILSFAFLLGGIYYVFIFYLPLLFVRTGGFSTWRRLWHGVHLISVVVIAMIFLGLWFLITNLFQGDDFFTATFHERIAISTDFEINDLLNHYLFFPFKAIIAFMPWFIFSWPAFCQSYKRVEKRPIIFTYMRTIVISIFVFSWLNPAGRVSDLLVLILPLAVMTGFHYPTVVRRYYKFFYKMIRFIFAITAILSFCLLIYYINMITNDSFKNENLVDFVLMVITLLLSLRYSFKSIKFSVIWQPFFLAIVLFHWCFNVFTDVRETKGIDYKENGIVLRKKIPENVMVYSLTDELYIRQMFYLDRPVSKIFPDKEIIYKVEPTDTFESIAFRYYGNVKLAKKLANLNLSDNYIMPKTIKITLPKEVYVIFYDTKPINLTTNAADYNWKAISPKVITNNGKKIQVWFGNKQ